MELFIKWRHSVHQTCNTDALQYFKNVFSSIWGETESTVIVHYISGSSSNAVTRAQEIFKVKSEIHLNINPIPELSNECFKIIQLYLRVFQMNWAVLNLIFSWLQPIDLWKRYQRPGPEICESWPCQRFCWQRPRRSHRRFDGRLECSIFSSRSSVVILLPPANTKQKKREEKR